jgi:hypothetical protein
MSIPVSLSPLGIGGTGIIRTQNPLSSITRESLTINRCDDVRAVFPSKKLDAIYGFWLPSKSDVHHPSAPFQIASALTI